MGALSSGSRRQRPVGRLEGGGGLGLWDGRRRNIRHLLPVKRHVCEMLQALAVASPIMIPLLLNQPDLLPVTRLGLAHYFLRNAAPTTQTFLVPLP